MLEAFRSINPLMLNPRSLAPTGEARQITGNLGHLTMPSLTAKIHGLNIKYYALVVNYNLSLRERKMLECMDRKDWSETFRDMSFTSGCKRNANELQEMIKMTELFTKEQNEKKKTKREEQVQKFGKLNAKHRLEDTAQRHMHDNIANQLKVMSGSHSLH